MFRVAGSEELGAVEEAGQSCGAREQGVMIGREVEVGRL